jgi:pantoate ligase / CMP/dCMP kinase
LEQSIAERDHQDSTRDVSPLRKAADAIEIQTDHLDIREVTEKIICLYQERLSGR